MSAAPIALFAGLCTVFALCRAANDSAADTAHAVPAWVFPLNSAAAANVPPDHLNPLHVPESQASYTDAQLRDLFSAPDWFPASHSAMPPIVASGRKPFVLACGYCHTPSGAGRPENAPLAGLPAAYIVQQADDFKSGARRSAAPYPYAPTDYMISTAAHASADDLSAAATYFSQQTLVQRVRVVESDRVPRSRVVGFVYAAVPGGGDEPLGQRLLEFAPDPARHEARDDRMQYVAYVPTGSIERGRSIAATGAGGLTVACSSCHGNHLQGVDSIPPLAGRSPTYLLRQLLGFQTGARRGAMGQPMLAVVTKLQLGDLIDVVAFAASLEPQAARTTRE